MPFFDWFTVRTSSILASKIVHGLPPDARALASGGGHDVGHVDASVMVGVTVRKESMVMVPFDGQNVGSFESVRVGQGLGTLVQMNTVQTVVTNDALPHFLVRQRTVGHHRGNSNQSP
jgi:hypothetical protein